MDAQLSFTDYVSAVEKQELMVVRDVRRFPLHAGKDFVLPHMVICLNHAGTFRAIYDHQEVVFGPNELAVVMPNHVIRPISCSDDYLVTLIVLSGDFLEELKQRTFSHDHAKYHLDPSCHLTEEQMAQTCRVIDTAEIICNVPAESLPHRHTMMLYMADLGFELLNAVRHAQDKTYTERREISIYNKFCDLLSFHYNKEHDVGFYASELHLSTRYFSKMIEEAIGMSASAWIKQYLITQAKQILYTRPDVNIQQLSYMLGFAEPAGFCRFFKKMTGQRPKEYRQVTREQNAT